MNQTRSRRPVRSFVRPIGLAALLGVAATCVVAALRAAEPAQVAVTVQVNGETYAGTLPRAASGASTQPLPNPPVPVPPAPFPPAVDDVPADLPVETIVGGPVPLAVHLDAVDALDPTALRDVRVSWDFGDPTAPRNRLDGYNAGHAYDAPGTYTITRTVAAPTGRSYRRYRVTASDDARTPIYVSDVGDDVRDGRTPATAVRSWRRVVERVGNAGNVAILFRRGDRFAVDRTMTVRGDDVRVAAWGDPAAARPVLALGVERGDVKMFEARGARLVVEGVAFDSDVCGDSTEKANTADAVNAGGRGLLVRDCEFRNVNHVVNGNGNPDGVLLAANVAPLPTGIRSYFAWVQGTDWTILDNRVANSTREHVIRIGGGERVNVTGNRFTNLDRRDPSKGGDVPDFAKTTINVQRGKFAWVAQNVLRDGPLSVGPLGGADGKAHPYERFVGATFEDNRLVNVQAQVQHGASGVTFRNNLIELDDLPAITAFGASAEYGRTCDDVTLTNNTAVNGGTRGSFARIGAGSTNVRVLRNLYVAPGLVAGAYESSPAVVVGDATMSAFAGVEGNRWPMPARASGDAAKRGPFIFAGAYQPAAKWQAAGPTDQVVPIAAGTLQLDGAGVDASRLPPP